MNFEFYYNNVPDKGLCRNNLIYTSLISDDKKTFCQWFHNDSDYHKGQNQVVDPELMNEKWEREIKYIEIMSKEYPEQVPEILDIDYVNKKLYLRIDGPDMWELAGCQGTDYSSVLPDWDKQMLEIIQSHKNLGIYKYSMHPSSYFIVDGKLKSINYFFSYMAQEETVRIKDFLSHISEDRRKELVDYSAQRGITWDQPTSLLEIQLLAFDSFRSNYTSSFINKAQEIYKCTQ